MNPSLIRKLEDLADRREEIEHLLADPAVMQDTSRFRDLSQEHAELGPVVEAFGRFRQTMRELEETELMAQDSDPELREMAHSESVGLREKMGELERTLDVLLLPKDPNDDRNIFLEIRAGTGGDEASLFAADLLRMYMRYAERRGWKTEVLSESESEVGGFKEVIARISGHGAYSRLKFESGAHRVQRVPETESQGRIHTSACTVAILPEVEAVGDIEINPADLRVDTFRASGAGGQHVNKTDSAIRITHLPTGTVVECQEERSQHKNRAKAMSLLASRLNDAERSKQAAETAQTRKSLVGSGDRSERIRTYNFPQGRVTDHRINLTLYKLDEFLTGELDPVIDPLVSEHQANQMAAMAAENEL